MTKFRKLTLRLKIPSFFSNDMIITVSIHLFIIFVLCIIWWILFYKKIKKEINDRLIDHYKVLQLSFTLLFIITRIIFGLMCFIPKFEYFYMPSLSLNTSFFYYFEVINDAWWINCMIHIHSIHNAVELNKETLRKIKIKETILLIFLHVIIIEINLNYFQSTFQ